MSCCRYDSSRALRRSTALSDRLNHLDGMGRNGIGGDGVRCMRCDAYAAELDEAADLFKELSSLLRREIERRLDMSAPLL
jgi:hypothetical protein